MKPKLIARTEYTTRVSIYDALEDKQWLLLEQTSGDSSVVSSHVVSDLHWKLYTEFPDTNATELIRAL